MQCGLRVKRRELLGSVSFVISLQDSACGAFGSVQFALTPLLLFQFDDAGLTLVLVL